MSTAPAPSPPAPAAQSALLAAAGTLGLCLVLAVGALAAPVVLVLAVLLVQAFFTLVVVRGSGLPGAGGLAALALAAGAAAQLLVLMDGSGDAGVLIGPLGLGFVAGFVVQLVRRDGRPALVVSMSAGTSAMVLSVLAAFWPAARLADAGRAVVLVALVGVACVAAVEALPLRPALRRPLGVLASAAAGAALGALVGLVRDEAAAGPAALLALGCGVVAAVGYAIADAVVASLRVDRESLTELSAVLPVLLAAPVAYLLSRVLL